MDLRIVAIYLFAAAVTQGKETKCSGPIPFLLNGRLASGVYKLVRSAFFVLTDKAIILSFNLSRHVTP